MKYKQQALKKLDSMSNGLKTLEHFLNRGELNNARKSLDNLKILFEDLNNQISIEQDQFKTNQVI